MISNYCEVVTQLIEYKYLIESLIPSVSNHHSVRNHPAPRASKLISHFFKIFTHSKMTTPKITNYYIFVKDRGTPGNRDQEYQKACRNLVKEFKKQAKQMEKEQSPHSKPAAKSKIIFFSWKGLCILANEDEIHKTYSETLSETVRGGPEEVLNSLRNLLEDQNGDIKLLYVVIYDDDCNAIKSAIESKMKCEAFSFHSFNKNSAKVSCAEQDASPTDSFPADYLKSKKS